MFDTSDIEAKRKENEGARQDGSGEGGKVSSIIYMCFGAAITHTESLLAGKQTDIACSWEVENENLCLHVQPFPLVLVSCHLIFFPCLSEEGTKSSLVAIWHPAQGQPTTFIFLVQVPQFSVRRVFQ